MDVCKKTIRAVPSAKSYELLPVASIARSGARDEGPGPGLSLIDSDSGLHIAARDRLPVTAQLGFSPKEQFISMNAAAQVEDRLTCHRTEPTGSKVPRIFGDAGRLNWSYHRLPLTSIIGLTP